jgi:hypothetical protein
VKTLFVVSPDAGTTEPASERRQRQRRMSLPRRISDRRGGSVDVDSPVERRASSERRGVGKRRRRPDRRIGLSPDLDLYLLGI